MKRGPASKKGTATGRSTAGRGIDYARGLRDGVPICLGYMSVGFSVGIAAHFGGLDVLQGFVLSLLGFSSSGEYGALTVIAENSGVAAMIVMSLVVNIRYLLMSFALSQRLAPGTSFVHRLLMGFGLTDEIFGVAIAQPSHVSPFYYYGAMSAALPGWSLGTAMGVAFGQMMPDWMVSGFSVMLFGMFLAIIVPAGRADRAVCAAILTSFAASFAAAHAPVLSSLSSGAQTVLLTVIIAAAFAVAFPRTACPRACEAGREPADGPVEAS